MKTIKALKQLAPFSMLALVLSIVFSCVGSLCLVYITFVYAKIISAISVAGYVVAKNYVFGVIIGISIYAISKTLAFIICNILQKQTRKVLENKMAEVLLSSSYKHHQHIVVKIQSGLEDTSSLFFLYPNTISTLVSAVGILVALFVCDIYLGLGALVFGALCIYVFKLLTKLEVRAENKINALCGEKQQALLSLMEGKNYAQDFGQEQTLINNFGLAGGNLVGARTTKRSIGLIKSVWGNFVWTLFVSLTLFYMINRVRLDYMELGLFVVSLPYLTSLLSGALGFLSNFSSLQNATASTKDLLAFLSSKPDQLISFEQNSTDGVKGHLIITDLYANGEQNANISGLSLVAQKGRPATIHFETNETESLFLSILRRKQAINKGTITIDGINIYDFTKQVYTQNLSIISKTPFFAFEDVFSNLQVFAGRNTIIKTLKQFGLWQILEKQYDGLKTKIQELWSNQMLPYILEIVQAYLKNTEIVVLSLPTFVLSPTAQNLLHKAIDIVQKNRTLVLLSTPQSCTLS
ncbi:MAG: ABC transporter ATP-binding protein [Clostridia bacterium]|nr:ABC transporter ATP-binding protein [Clostridia bacterium]